MANEVTVVFKGQDQNLSSSFQKAGSEAKALSGHVGGVGKSIGQIAAAGVGLMAGRGLVDFLGDSIREARESQKVNASTAQGIKTMGAESWITADAVGALSQRISDKIGVDDEAIQSSANLLLTFGKVRNEVGQGNDIFNRATMAAQDMAAKGFGDADSAAKMLGKALNDPLAGITALSRAGVTFTEGQKDQIKHMLKVGDVLGAQKLIMQEVEKQVGGTAEATATAADKMAVKWSNFKETLGTAVLPILDDLTTKLSGVVDWASGHTEIVGWALKAGAALAGLGLLVKGIKIVDDVKGWVDGIGRGFDAMKLAARTTASEMAASMKLPGAAATTSSAEQVAANGRAATSATESATVIEGAEARAAGAYRGAGLAAGTAATQTGAAGEAAVIAGGKAEKSGGKAEAAAGKWGLFAKLGAAVGIGAVAVALDDMNIKAAGGAEHLQNMAQGMHNFIEGAKQLATDPIQAFKDLSTQLSGIHDQFIAEQSPISQFWASIHNASQTGQTAMVQSFWTGGAKAAQAIADGISSQAPAVTKSVWGLSTAAQAGTAGMAPAGQSIGAGFGQNIGQGVSSATGTVSGASQGLWNAATSATSGMPASGTSPGAGFGKNLASGIQGQGPNVSSASGALSASAKSGVSNLPGSGSGPGSSFGNSLASGIMSAVGNVAHAAQSAASAAHVNLGTLYGEGLSFGGTLAAGINASVGSVIAAAGRVQAAVASAGSRNARATGGIIGAAATGGERSGLTLVGEMGPELVSLPTGSKVSSNADTRSMVGSGDSSPAGVSIAFVGNTSDALATVIMEMIRTGKIQLNVN